MLLYMDRQTLPNVATRVTTEFGLKEVQYGNVEMWFGYAFAVGAFLWGCVADRWSVRWLYPALVLAWSAMGFLTGLVKDYEGCSSAARCWASSRPVTGRARSRPRSGCSPATSARWATACCKAARASAPSSPR